MIDQGIDRMDDFLARCRLPLTIVSVAWFALACAAYAGFVELPALRLVTGLPGVMIAGAWNGIWWGFLYPRAQQRRIARQAESKTNG